MSGRRQDIYQPLRYVDSVATPDRFSQLTLGVIIPSIWAVLLSIVEFTVFSWEVLISGLSTICRSINAPFTSLRKCGSLSEVRADVSQQVHAGVSRCSSHFRSIRSTSSSPRGPHEETNVDEFFEFTEEDASTSHKADIIAVGQHKPLSPVSGRVRSESIPLEFRERSAPSTKQRLAIRRLRTYVQACLCWLAAVYMAFRPVLLLPLRVLQRLRVRGQPTSSSLPLITTEPSVVGPAHIVVVFGAGSLEGEAAVRLHSFRLREVRSQVAPRRGRSVQANNNNLKGTVEELLDSSVGVVRAVTNRAIRVINRCVGVVGLKGFNVSHSDEYQVHTIVEPTGCMVLACDSDVVALRQRYRRYPGVQCLPYYWGGRDDTARVKEVVAQSRRSLFGMVVIVPSRIGSDVSSTQGASSLASTTRTRIARLQQRDVSAPVSARLQRGDVSAPISARTNTSNSSLDHPRLALRSRAGWVASGVAVVHQNKWATIPELDEFCSEDHLTSTVVPRVLQPLRIAKDLLPYMMGCAHANISQHITPPEWERLSTIERLILDALFDIVGPRADPSHSEGDESDSADSQSLAGCEYGSMKSSRSQHSHHTARHNPHTNAAISPRHSGPKPRVILVTSSTRSLSATVESGSPQAHGGESTTSSIAAGRGFGAFVDVSLMLAALNELQRSPYCKSGPTDIISICHIHCDHATVVSTSKNKGMGMDACGGVGAEAESLSRGIGMRSQAFQSILEAKDAKVAIAAVKKSVPQFQSEVGLYYNSPYDFSVSIPLVDFLAPPVEGGSIAALNETWDATTTRETSPSPSRPCPPLQVGALRNGAVSSTSPAAASPADGLILCRDRTVLDSWAVEAEHTLGTRKWKLANQVERHRARKAKLQ